MSELLPKELVTKNAYDVSALPWSLAHNDPKFWEDEMPRFHELLPEGSILEIGAGGARDAKKLVALGYQYTGTDVSPGMLAVARAELPGHKFIEQSVYSLDLPEAPFDGFWASAVLLHIPKSRIDEALQRVKSVMRDNAIGFIS